MRLVSDVLLGFALAWLLFSTLAVFGWVNPQKGIEEREKAGNRAVADVWSFVLFACLAVAVRFWPW